MPGLMASNKSRKNNPVVIEGSLNDLIGRTEGLAFCAVVLAHLSISVSLMGRPWPDLERDVRVFVMFILYHGNDTGMLNMPSKREDSVLTA